MASSPSCWRHDRGDYVENRIHAGVPEYAVEKLLTDPGAGARMAAEVLLYKGINAGHGFQSSIRRVL